MPFPIFSLFLFLLALLSPAHSSLIPPSPLELTLDPRSQAGASNSTNNSGQGSPPGADDTGNQSTPGATIAMIILYALTALISLCFLTIVITGAIRARLHPEWNLPRNPASSTRARVLGRAILESIPIIKFGESAKSGAQATDVELARHKGVRTVVSEDADAAPPTTTDTVNTTTAASATPSADNDEMLCSICVEPFVKGDDVRVLPQCNHNFHPKCLDPWLLNVSGTCPLCRLDLTPSTENIKALDPGDGRIARLFLNRWGRRQTASERREALRALRDATTGENQGEMSTESAGRETGRGSGDVERSEEGQDDIVAAPEPVNSSQRRSMPPQPRQMSRGDSLRMLR